jgi:hypothetical protein
MLALASAESDPLLGAEIGSRWDLLEAAFAMHVPVETLGTDGDVLFRVEGNRRTAITGTLPVLNGYQNGCASIAVSPWCLVGSTWTISSHGPFFTMTRSGIWCWPTAIAISPRAISCRHYSFFRGCGRETSTISPAIIR